MRRRTLRMVALLCVALHLGACTRWEPTTIAPRTLIEGERPATVRVTRSDETQLEVPEPIIRSDSIVSSKPRERAYSPNGRAEDSNPPPAVALSDVQSVAVKRTAVGRTVLAIVLTPVVLGTVALVAVCAAANPCMSP